MPDESASLPEPDPDDTGCDECPELFADPPEKIPAEVLSVCPLEVPELEA
ncbi:MAG: hypothetical protein AAF532_13895 [Planctomycetota bacterium]